MPADEWRPPKADRETVEQIVNQLTADRHETVHWFIRRAFLERVERLGASGRVESLADAERVVLRASPRSGDFPGD